MAVPSASPASTPSAPATSGPPAPRAAPPPTAPHVPAPSGGAGPGAPAAPGETVPRARSGRRTAAAGSTAVPGAPPSPPAGPDAAPAGPGSAQAPPARRTVRAGGPPGPAPDVRPGGGPGAARPDPRPRLTELRLSAFARHRGARFPLGPVTLFTGPSGSGKSAALAAYEALARLGGGASVQEVFPDPVALVPERARPDAQRRRGFRIGCTADGAEGPVRLDVAVQAEPDLRIVGERLTAGGLVLLETALRDPGRRSVQAAWHTAGSSPVTKAPLPDDRLGTALLPLRVAGKTDGQRRVLAAAEQMVVALRSVFACDPRPVAMRAPVRTGSGRLLRGCDNLADVLWRTRAECGRRHGLLVDAVRTGCAGPVADLLAEPLGDGTVRALLDRGDGHRSELAGLGDGELRYLALALVLFTGPGVLEVDAPGEVPDAMRSLTVLADGFDRCLDPRQRAELLGTAVLMGERGHIRLVGAVSDADLAAEAGTITVVHLEA
ncbi:ATP-binding protein [Streptomyces sp. NPDC094468]|uniref:ATP-binding protein n=1 Tax=Streptomyces sp. NPDC094468 TaxID=3366066 RepID=UPI0037F56781